MLTALTAFTFNSYGQQKTDSLKLKQARQQHAFYRKTLQVDSAKSVQVARIQDSYKAGMSQLMADTSLHEEVKRVRIKTLMDAKNQQLRQLLNPAQQEKIIPSTERTPSSAPKQR